MQRTIVTAFLTTLLLVAAGGGRARAQHDADAAPPRDSARAPVAQRQIPPPRVTVPRITTPIEIDGVIDAAEWAASAVLMEFHETYPVENGIPPIPIHVRLARDDAHLYVAFRIEEDPASIRASWRQRDHIWNDDYVGIFLDTYGEGNWGYMLFANPFGIQGDTRYSSTGGEDDGLDVIYQSDGRITDRGYEVEFAVPFRSLRFPEGGAREWRMNLWITHPRASRATYSWAPIYRSNPCLLCQLGHAQGMEDVEAGKSLLFLPAVTASQTSWRRDAWDPASVTDVGHVRGEASLGVRYDPASSTTLELALNPDFSQVESDAAQIDVNSAFALFYPERRPFFQEGSDLYSSYLQAVYTRSINAPLAAVKATGNWSGTSLIAIGAWDEQSPVLLPFEEQSGLVADAGGSWSTVVRARQALGGASWLGGIFTDRRFGVDWDFGSKASGTLAGVDGALRLSEQLTLKLLGLVSHTREGNDSARTAGFGAFRFARGAHTAAFDGESFTGHAAVAAVEYSDRHYWGELRGAWLSPTFRTANGFVTQNDRREVNLQQRLMFYPGGWIDELHPTLIAGRVWNDAGVWKDEWLMPQLYVSMKAQTRLTASYLWSNEFFGGRQHDGIRRWSLSVGSSFSEYLQLDGQIEQGRFVARTIPVAALGTGTNVEIAASIKPWTRLVLEPSFLFAELRHPDGWMIFNGSISRVRGWYQFTRELSLRLVVQYDHFDRRVSIEPLVTWQLDPWSMFYVGMTRQYDHLADPRDPFSPRLWDAGTAQYFLKFQYLFQY